MAWVPNTEGTKRALKILFIKEPASNAPVKSTRTYNGINVGYYDSATHQYSGNPTIGDVLDGFNLLFASSFMGGSAIISTRDEVTTVGYGQSE